MPPLCALKHCTDSLQLTVFCCTVGTSTLKEAELRGQLMCHREFSLTRCKKFINNITWRKDCFYYASLITHSLTKIKCLDVDEPIANRNTHRLFSSRLGAQMTMPSLFIRIFFAKTTCCGFKSQMRGGHLLTLCVRYVSKNMLLQNVSIQASLSLVNQFYFYWQTSRNMRRKWSTIWMTSWL